MKKFSLFGCLALLALLCFGAGLESRFVKEFNSEYTWTNSFNTVSFGSALITLSKSENCTCTVWVITTDTDAGVYTNKIGSRSSDTFETYLLSADPGEITIEQGEKVRVRLSNTNDAQLILQNFTGE